MLEWNGTVCFPENADWNATGLKESINEISAFLVSVCVCVCVWVGDIMERETHRQIERGVYVHVTLCLCVCVCARACESMCVCVRAYSRAHARKTKGQLGHTQLTSSCTIDLHCKLQRVQQHTYVVTAQHISQMQTIIFRSLPVDFAIGQKWIPLPS